jgi:hypothetical protein
MSPVGKCYLFQSMLSGHMENSARYLHIHIYVALTPPSHSHSSWSNKRVELVYILRSTKKNIQTLGTVVVIHTCYAEGTLHSLELVT